MPKGNAANCGVLTNAFVLATKSDPNAHETVVSHIVEREARPQSYDRVPSLDAVG